MAVPSGQVVGLLGHNGAGKSTLIKLLLGLIKPTGGQVRTLGRDPAGHDTRTLRSRLGYLPESVSFYKNLTGGEVIDYLAQLKGAPRREGRQLLARMGLAAAITRRVKDYSKGMRQRLGLAQALLGTPDLLLLDEPTTGLDPMATRDFFALMEELRKAGKTVLISSHLLAELEPHLDRAVILGGGRLLAQGSVSDLRQRAGLPVHIDARFADDSAALLQQPWISEFAGSVWAHGDHSIRLDVSMDRKVEVLRRLSAIPHLVDIRVSEPTLASLYELVDSVEAKSPEASHA